MLDIFYHFSQLLWFRVLTPWKLSYNTIFKMCFLSAKECMEVNSISVLGLRSIPKVFQLSKHTVLSWQHAFYRCKPFKEINCWFRSNIKSQKNLTNYECSASNAWNLLNTFCSEGPWYGDTGSQIPSPLSHVKVVLLAKHNALAPRSTGPSGQ